MDLSFVGVHIFIFNLINFSLDVLPHTSNQHPILVFLWRLAEAQDQLCSLEVHSSESVEQEHARTLTCPTELTHTLEEWRRKESMLGGQEPNRFWSMFISVQSIINVQKQPVEMDQDKCKSFQQKYEQELRYFGMLRRWDDSQRFLADTPQLICEETANYLILWCMRLQQEGKEALMDQVAHQAVVMQFILEMASNSQQDPRGCFRHFFHKAKEGQDVYLEVFHTELEAFKHRVKEYSVTCRSNTANGGLGSPWALYSLLACDVMFAYILIPLKIL
uniref:Hsp90 co-chaperone Cdc37-like 1 n=1 Tax=Gouania willdenowi TaxID=441366 RepID=A0A8C5H003_GOUWI